MIEILLALALKPTGDADLKMALQQCANLESDVAQLSCFRNLVSPEATVSIPDPKPDLLLDTKVSKFGFRSVKVDGGVFDMGSPETDQGRRSNESRHQVTIGNSFWIMEKEVSQNLWKKIMGGQPSVFVGCGDDCPPSPTPENPPSPRSSLRPPPPTPTTPLYPRDHDYHQAQHR